MTDKLPPSAGYALYMERAAQRIKSEAEVGNYFESVLQSLVGYVDRLVMPTRSATNATP